MTGIVIILVTAAIGLATGFGLFWMLVRAAPWFVVMGLFAAGLTLVVGVVAPEGLRAMERAAHLAQAGHSPAGEAPAIMALVLGAPFLLGGLVGWVWTARADRRASAKSTGTDAY